MVSGLFHVKYGNVRDLDDRDDLICVILARWCDQVKADPMDTEVTYWGSLDGPVLDEEESLHVDEVYLEVECR